jgi:uncharacterized GH25 family protein
MRSPFLGLALCALPALARAHDFWLQPQAFRASPGVATPLTLQVGHGPNRQRSPIRKDRVLAFFAEGPSGRLDLMDDLHPGAPVEDGRLRLPSPGRYAVLLRTDSHAESHLPALRFNDYLTAEGLTPALEARRRSGRMNADGAERYSRVTKTLIQVGDGGAQAVLKPLGAPLELVPEADPWSDTASFPVRVYWQGRPLAGALVKLTDLAHDAEPVATQRSDTAGRVRFQLSYRATWLLTVVWTRPLPPSAEVDFETTFSSLTFSTAADR